MAMRLVIVDDNLQFLEAARALLEREGMVVAGLASTTGEALELVEELRPDAALVDIDLGEESGFDLARLLAQPEHGQPCPVVLISTYAKQDVDDLVDSSPAVGFVSKSHLSRRAVEQCLAAGTTG